MTSVTLTAESLPLTSDIFRSVALGRPHTFFHLSHSDESNKSTSGARILSSSSPDSHSPPQPKPLKLFLGLPTELIFCIASTNNLAGSQLPPAEVKQQTVSLEARIRDWRPSTDHLPEMLDSVATIEWFRTCEAWRHVRPSFFPCRVQVTDRPQIRSLPSSCRPLSSSCTNFFTRRAACPRSSSPP